MPKMITHCIECGNELQEVKKGNKFCSLACRRIWSFNNYKPLKGKKVVRTCQQCGKTFEIYKYFIKRGNGIFCSKECQGKKYSGENHFNWKGGISILPYSLEYDSKIRKDVIKLFNHTCPVCGRHKHDITSIFATHHIDYNPLATGHKDNPFFLIPLCQSCHNKTNYHRQYWQEYLTNLLYDMFKWGIISQSEYEKKIMYCNEGKEMRREPSYNPFLIKTTIKTIEEILI